LESKDHLKRPIYQPAKYPDAAASRLSPPCGFASTEANIFEEEAQWAGLRTVAEAAREVWGKP